MCYLALLAYSLAAQLSLLFSLAWPEHPRASPGS
uniref:Uncharacterized protein n=1 Tax=Arundo donax TaxID=35708 RepID=A0A0A9HRX1_ARUDO